MTELKIGIRTETERGETIALHDNLEEIRSLSANELYDAEISSEAKRGTTGFVRTYTPCLVKDGKLLSGDEAVETGYVVKHENTRLDNGIERSWFTYRWK